MNKISSDYAKYAIKVLQQYDDKNNPLAEAQRSLQLGALKNTDAFSKHFNSKTRQFDIDHEDVNDDLATSMLRWEYADKERQTLSKEYHMVLDTLSKPGRGLVWTGENSQGFYYNIEWKRLEDIANNTTKPTLLFADETEETLASRGL